MSRRYGISRTYWLFSLTIILTLGVLLGSLYVYGEYLSYQDRITDLVNGYYEKQKSVLKLETERTLDHFRLIFDAESARGRPEGEIRALLLDHMQDKRYHENGILFVMGKKGTLLSHPDKNLVGKNISRVSESSSPDVGNLLIDLARRPEGGFTEHYWRERQHLKPVLKLVFVKTFEPLRIVVGTEISLEKMQEITEQARKDMNRVILQRSIIILSLLVLIVLVSTAGFYRFASRMRMEFNLFFSFFKNDPLTADDIDPSRFSFYETALLAQNANRMNRDIREKTSKLNDEIQERKQAQEELIKLSQAVEQSPVAVVITDLDGTIEYVNPKFTEMTGFMPSEAIGNNPRILRSGFQPDSFYGEFWKTILAGKDWTGEFHNKKKNGEIYWESSLVTGIRNSEGKITHYLKVGSDISERKRLEQNMEYLAHHDGLTGLPNRLLFSDRVNHAIARARRNGKKVAVMIMDLDNFKNVNDTLGHDAGDTLLNMVVTRFMKFLREEDTASRMGGDEFNFLFNDLAGTEGLMKILQRILESFREPFVIKNTALNVTPSIGISLFPDDGDDLGTLIKKADIALYEVKGSGKNNFRFYRNK